MLLKEIRAAASESARVAKLVQDAGLDERRARLAEAEQLDIGRMLGLVLAAWGLDPDDTAVRQTVAAAVEQVRAGDLSPLPSRVPSAPVLEAAPVAADGEEQ